MASSSTQITPASSPTIRSTYDVFLSFFGKDTRNNFTDHLYHALLQKKINVFRDDEKLKHGEDISQELLKAIEESRCAVVVISENYAASKWCLAELTKIMECKTQTQMIVLPVFYHVEPSNVRKQKRTFEEAFAQYMKSPEVDKGRIEAWRANLKEVATLKGWHVSSNSSEGVVVEEITTEIDQKLYCNSLNISESLFGMESRVEELETLLCMGCHDVRCIGIYGMSGIGKSTLAKRIYDTTSSKFQARYFLTEDGEVEVMGNRSSGKKVLIVIDDVDGKKHLGVLEKLEEALKEEKRKWFGPGSRIILISVDHQLIKPYVDHDFKVKELDDEEALELFSVKAFKKPFPPEDYFELSKDIVRYAEGLPLAIKVFGSSFFGKSMDAWRSARKWLEANLDARILDRLKIGFNGLGDTQKRLFLDIACFLNGRSSNWLEHILESFGYIPEIDIQVLMDKSLIKIRDDKIWMHNLLVQMGRQIVKDEMMYKCTRLWDYEDIIDALKNDISIDAIESIRLLMPGGDEVELNLKPFSKMWKLRMIEIIPEGSDFEDYFLKEPPKNPSSRDIVSWTKKWAGSINPFKFILKDSYPLEFMPKRFERCLGKLQWVGDHSKLKLSDKLCLINWFQYPLYSLPATFQSKNLVELKLPGSHVKKLWSGSKNFGKLRVIHLKYSTNLTETPDLTNVPNLEKLELSYCTHLSKVHPSIESLKQLKLLDLKGCRSLKNLPKDLSGMESLEELDISQTSVKQLPSSIGSLKKFKVLKGGGTLSTPISFEFPKSFSSLSSLTYLDLQYCNLSHGMIPNDFDSFYSLKVLCLDGNKFKGVPEFVWKLSKLEDLSLSYCNISDGEIPNDISYLTSLRKICLKGNKFTAISDNVSQIPYLKKLNLSDNRKLLALPKLPCSLSEINRSNCLSLNTFSMGKCGSTGQIWMDIFGVFYYGYGGKYHKNLSLNSIKTIPRTDMNSDTDMDSEEYIPSTDLNTEESIPTEMYMDAACGPTLGSEIPEWFDIRSNGPHEIQVMGNLRRFALFIVYEVHESSNRGGSYDTNPDFFEIAFQGRLYGRVSRFVEVHPFGRTDLKRGRNGVWVLMWDAFPLVVSPEDVTVSVSTNSPNIEVKEYGIHGANPAAEDWLQVLHDISDHEWTEERLDDIYDRAFQKTIYSPFYYD